VQVAIELLDRVGGVGGLVRCGVEELCATHGVGPAKAAQLKAAVELGRRSMAAPLSTGMRISTSGEVFRHFHPALRDLKHEIFKVVLLDAKNTVVKETTVSEGSLTLSVVHPREVFALAVRESAAGILFVHNHPSGDPMPSLEDRQLTDRLAAAGRLLGIRVLDHLIIGDGRYVSFADEGWLKGQLDE
jgi:DNA repair protein RadC